MPILLVFCLTLPMWLGSSAATRQDDDTVSSVMPKVKRVRGWRVPGRDEYTLVVESKTVDSAGVAVLAKTHGLAGERAPLTDLENFMLRGQQITVWNRLCRVAAFRSYEAHGKVFTYQVTLEGVQADAYGEQTPMFSHFVYNYVDEDGDNVFETRALAKTGVAPAPQWVKTRKK
ncbi:MAG: hypothetical protein ACREAM_26340 [Blastocatellia bacterium]